VSETGFLPILKAITSILTKNPVSWVRVRGGQKPGFYRY